MRFGEMFCVNYAEHLVAALVAERIGNLNLSIGQVNKSIYKNFIFVAYDRIVFTQ